MVTSNILRRSTTIVLLLSYVQLISAVQFFTNVTVPANLTTACTNALLEDVANCNTVVASFRPGLYYDESILNSTCTSSCASDLVQYESSIESACDGQSWNGYEDTAMPLAIIADMLLYAFNLTCMVNSGAYCNVIAAEYAYMLDPGSK
jgi:hypothetical protein